MKFIAHDYNITLPHAAHTEVRFLTTKCQLSSVQSRLTLTQISKLRHLPSCHFLHVTNIAEARSVRIVLLYDMIASLVYYMTILHATDWFIQVYCKVQTQITA